MFCQNTNSADENRKFKIKNQKSKISTKSILISGSIVINKLICYLKFVGPITALSFELFNS